MLGRGPLVAQRLVESIGGSGGIPEGGAFVVGALMHLHSLQGVSNLSTHSAPSDPTSQAKTPIDFVEFVSNFRLDFLNPMSAPEDDCPPAKRAKSSPPLALRRWIDSPRRGEVTNCTSFVPFKAPKLPGPEVDEGDTFTPELLLSASEARGRKIGMVISINEESAAEEVKSTWDGKGVPLLQLQCNQGIPTDQVLPGALCGGAESVLLRP